MLAMIAAGIEVEEYDAYEIDKYAVTASKHNFPQIEQHGDVFEADFTAYRGYDFLVGGSPCTYWSIAQRPDKRETVASGIGWELFSQYVRALHEAQPRMFIYENNKSMSNDIRASITETFGFEPICINSALVSAQNRQRLYWVGVRQDDGTYRKASIEQPADRGILLKDVLDSAFGIPSNDKSYAILASYTASIGDATQRRRNSQAAEPVCVASRGRNPDNPSDRTAGAPTEQRSEAHEDGKTNTLTSVNKDNLIPEPAALQEQPYGRVANADGKYDRRYEAKTDGKSAALTSVESRRMLAEPVRCFTFPREDGVQTQSKQYRVYETAGKSTTICAEGGGMGAKTGLYATQENPMKEQRVYEVKDGMIEVNGKRYPIKLRDGRYIIRKLTVTECMRLQTVPEWYYFSCVSNTQAYKMLGNGWTVEVIAHLIRGEIAESEKSEIKEEAMTQFEIIMRTDTPELPAEIGNFEEVKAAISEALKEYSTDAIVTADSVKDAEKTRAHLRRVKDQVETYRKDAKAAYLEKFNKLESQCKELSGMIEKPIATIDGKIKEFENAENDKKYKELQAFFDSIIPPEWLKLDDVISPKWKNKTATISKLKEEISEAVCGIEDNLKDLEKLYGQSPLWTAILEKFRTSKDKSQTLVYATQLERQHSEEQKRAEEIQRQREAEEAARAQIAQNAISEPEAPQAVTQPETVQAAAPAQETQAERLVSGSFRVTGTREQIKALAQFMKSTGIRYEVIK